MPVTNTKKLMKEMCSRCKFLILYNENRIIMCYTKDTIVLKKLMEKNTPCDSSIIKIVNNNK